MDDSATIAVAGAAAVDMTVCDAPANWAGGAGGDDFLAAPVRMLRHPARMHLGGNGGAAAYVIGRLGARALLSAPIGEDAAGDLVRRWLGDAGVQVIAPPGASTMLSITAATGAGRRLGTLQHPGPPVDWRRAAEADAAWLLVAAHSQVTGADLEAVDAALARFRGTRVLDSGVGWMRDIEPGRVHALWRRVDVLTGTVEELAHWTGRADPPEIAAFVLRCGPRRVVVKMGAGGAGWQALDEPWARQPARPLARCDISIGAGDGFNGALLVSLSRGQSLEHAVSAAQRVAAAVVETGRGVQGWQGTA